MKKLLLIMAVCSVLSACAFHSKQPIDETYYKNTQSVEWPEQTNGLSSVSSSKRVSVPASNGTGVAPAAAEIKLECERASSNFKCRYGLDECGWGCNADGSNCRKGSCLQSDCDNVMGQKWELVKVSSSYYGCQHPSYPIVCRKDGDKYRCYDRGQQCGYDCNANGTLCRGENNCWDKYR